MPLSKSHHIRIDRIIRSTQKEEDIRLIRMSLFPQKFYTKKNTFYTLTD